MMGARPLCVAVALGALCVGAEAADSTYTSIQRADCHPPSPSVAKPFIENDLGVRECPAPDGWRLLFVSSQTHSWFEIHGPDARWSGEQDVVYERPIGLFPNVGGVPLVEWRRDDAGRVRALIFRLMAQDPRDPVRQVSRLFVVRLSPGPPCLIGRVTSNRAARALADQASPCTRGSGGPLSSRRPLVVDLVEHVERGGRRLRARPLPSMSASEECHPGADTDRLNDEKVGAIQQRWPSAALGPRRTSLTPAPHAERGYEVNRVRRPSTSGGWGQT
jgi:hypothetical protein